MVMRRAVGVFKIQRHAAAYYVDGDFDESAVFNLECPLDRSTLNFSLHGFAVHPFELHEPALAHSVFSSSHEL